MRLLIVAHPDDEALWFDPEAFDRIVIAFGPRYDKPDYAERRAAAVKAHPLAERIDYLGLHEGDWESVERALRIYAKQMTNGPGSMNAVTTHGAHGEYGHAHHIQLHNKCMALFDCPVNGKNPAMFRAIRAAYEKAGCWTWH